MNNAPPTWRPEEKERKPRTTSRVTVPKKAHPLVRFVFSEMKRALTTYEEVAIRSGVLPHTLKAWRTDNCPTLRTIEAVIGALGWRLIAVPERSHFNVPTVATYERLPTPVREALDNVAGDWGSPELRELAAMISWTTLSALVDEPPAEVLDRRRSREAAHQAMRISEPLSATASSYPYAPRNKEELAAMLGLQRHDLAREVH